ncbi:MAG: YkvA family protein [Novosphingobium sp.]
MIERLKQWAKALKRNITLLWLAANDPRTPLAARLMAWIVAGYALSPIDLIPDFIPVLGYVDDLLLVPAGIWLALRLIPADLRDELSLIAEQTPWPGSARAAGFAVVGIWAACALWLAVAAINWGRS